MSGRNLTPAVRWWKEPFRSVRNVGLVVRTGLRRTGMKAMTEAPKIILEYTKRTDARLLHLMEKHYSSPKGFVGRNICYAVLCAGCYWGHIVGGSAPRWLSGRDAFFGDSFDLQKVIDNIFFHVEPVLPYPSRNFTTRIIKEWRSKISQDWFDKYGSKAIGFETLVELPRKGTLYLKDGWIAVGITKGQTCKRVAGKGTDSWSGRRVWDTVNLRPKLVLCRGLN